MSKKGSSAKVERIRDITCVAGPGSVNRGVVFKGGPINKGSDLPGSCLLGLVMDVSEPRLIMLFTEGLSEPLRGWVKALKPTLISIQDSITRTRYMADSVPKSQSPSKSFPPPYLL